MSDSEPDGLDWIPVINDDSDDLAEVIELREGFTHERAVTAVEHVLAHVSAVDLGLAMAALGTDAPIDNLGFKGFLEPITQRMVKIEQENAAREAVARKRQALDAEPMSVWLLKDVPHEDVRWRVADLWPTDGRLLITAQRKTGKTQACLNIARCLITGEQLFDRFEVTPLAEDETVAFMNFEVSPSQFALWATEAGIPGDRLLTVHMRGKRNPFSTAMDREALIKTMREHNVAVLIVDPFGRAYSGISQNDNGEVNAWLMDLDRFATEAGARELVLTTHAGWGEKGRTRGASALEDWPDVIVKLTKEDDSPARFFSAFGRDVEVEEDALAFDPETRRLSLVGTGSRKGVAAGLRLSEHVDQLILVAREYPGINTSAIEDRWRAMDVRFTKGDVSKASKAAVALGLVRVETGPRKSRMHYVVEWS